MTRRRARESRPLASRARGATFAFVLALSLATPALAQEPADSSSAETIRLVAEPSGLRLVAFGQPADLVVATLETLLGEPDADTGWRPATASPFGVCPGERVRGARWGRLRILMSDGPTRFGSAGYEHFFAYD
ncbi:MAG: hypothetical protein R3326_10120, partial [Gemmatimonadota bacterium]|nr:hypothetical protein [Gemmatimonadota bacterium]